MKIYRCIKESPWYSRTSHKVGQLIDENDYLFLTKRGKKRFVLLNPVESTIYTGKLKAI